MKQFQTFSEELQASDLGFIQRPERLTWDYRESYSLEDIRRWLIEGMSYFIGSEPRWLPEYDGIVRWLQHNEGKGLLLHGGCGLGKTLITTKLLPLFLHRGFGKIIEPYEARRLKALFDKGHTMLPVHIIDDVGTESEENIYGTRRTFFSELVDIADKRGALMIISSNLSKEELKAYGARTYDRLRSMCLRLELRGESLRG